MHQENIKIIKVYACVNSVSKGTKQKLTELNRVDNSTLKVEYFNTPLSN